MCVATVFELMTSSVGDLTLRATFGEQAEDLPFARAQARRRRRCGVRSRCPFVGVGEARRSERLTRARSSPASSGFVEVVVGTEHEPGRAVERVRLSRRHEDDRQLVVERLVELAHDLEAVAGARQLDLDDRERRPIAPEPLDELVGRRRRSRVVAEPDGDLNRRQA